MNTKHKLTELQKIEIRATHLARQALPTVAQMARKYGVSTGTIWNAINDDYAGRKLRRCLAVAMSTTSHPVDGDGREVVA